VAKVPHVLHQHINTAYPNTPCVVASMMPDGYPQVTPRGSVVVIDDETLGFWNRGGGTTATNVSDGAKVTVFYRNPAVREFLPNGGTARFYGTAELHKTGPLREKVWETMVQPERDRDPEKKGFAVIVRLERAEHLNGKPLA
jgi:uncharacterized protein